jgi:hypothetical protein
MREAEEAKLVSDALALSSESAANEAKDRAVLVRQEAARRLKPEPLKGAGAGTVVTVCFRLPPGCGKGRLERRFTATAPPSVGTAAPQANNTGCSNGSSSNGGVVVGHEDTVQSLLDFLRSREELSEVSSWELHLSHGHSTANDSSSSSSSSGGNGTSLLGRSDDFHAEASGGGDIAATAAGVSSSSTAIPAAERPLSSLGLGSRVLLLVRDADA